MNVNGMAPAWTGWSLDGANITEFQLGGTIIQPNVDALQEFKVESANMDAEYGHTPSVINATLKSGGNQFHGDIYEFLRNSTIDARNFFYLPPPGSSLTKSRYGAISPAQHSAAQSAKTKRSSSSILKASTEPGRGRQQHSGQRGRSARVTSATFFPRRSKIRSPASHFPATSFPANRLAPQTQYLLRYMPLRT